MKRLRPLLAAILLLAALPSAAHASPTQESMFQDDPLLVYAAPERVESTLDRLAQFGVDRIRVSVFWRIIAPANDQIQKPAFDATDPAAYPQEHWERYDRLIRAAQARGILVNLNFTSPIPRWAAGESPRADLQETFGPNPEEFGSFVRAVARRYDGTYMGLPRVDYWSIWNEPNQAGWLTPQWSPDPRNSTQMIESAPSLYRRLVASAWTALADSGHGSDTILVGETAPQGQKELRDVSQSIDALRFVRQLYCVDDNLNLLTGSDAEVRGCPVGNPAQFVAENPGLFHASGYAHHPYALLTPPGRKSNWPDWVSMSDLRALSRELTRIYLRYGQPMPSKRGVPLYITEYGYQTKPDPFFAAISLAKQAAWMNQAEYISFKNPSVRSMSQFLLVDDGPAAGFDVKKDARLAWRTFQSGLVFANGKRKPSFKAYVTPLYVKQRAVRRGRTVGIFGMLRSAKAGTLQTVRIQFRARGRKRWQTQLTRKVGGPRHYFETRVRVPASGDLRLLWKDGSRLRMSRIAPIVAR
ncbi:MAG: hypothetical protein QOD83_2621 [Solirubrobacteraceae bacterium]|nr:hypothetical protein [Solirubrobacteraceae bacterium]